MRFPFSRRALVVLSLGALLAASAALVSSALGRGSRATAAPSLTLADRSPATVRGRHFKHATRVKVTLTQNRRWRRSVRPSAGGGFTVSFPTAVDRCGPWSVSAVQGTTQVRLQSPAKPMCAPQGAP